MSVTPGQSKDATPLSESEVANLDKRTARDLAAGNESRTPANKIIVALALKLLPGEVAARITKRIDDSNTESGGAE